MSEKSSIISSIVQSSDENFCRGVIEITQWRETGILAEGFVRDCARELEKKFNIPMSISIKISEDNILETAARRFVKKAQEGANNGHRV